MSAITARERSGGRRAGPAAVTAWLERRPALVVAAVFAGAALVTAYYASRVSEWLVMTDELQYVKVGLGIAGTGSPVPPLRGEYYAAYNVLYPALLAPLLGLLDMPAAFRAAHVLNGILMASTAVPAYLLARAVRIDRLAAY